MKIDLIPAMWVFLLCAIECTRDGHDVSHISHVFFMF